MRDTIVSVLPVGLLLRVLLVATRAPVAQQGERGDKGNGMGDNRTLSEDLHEMVVSGPCKRGIEMTDDVKVHTAPSQAASCWPMMAVVTVTEDGVGCHASERALT
jgi:hypothetical protein